MNAVQRRTVMRFLTLLTLLSMVLSYLDPGIAFQRARAQDATTETTETPIDTTPSPTDAAPTDAPQVDPTAVPPTEQPTEQITEEPPVTEPTAVPPVEPTVTPVVQLTGVSEDFNDLDTTGWVISPGWSITAEGENSVLSAVTPGESAVLPGIDWDHLLISLRALIQEDPASAPVNTLNLTLRSSVENYTLILDAYGALRLYRGDSLLAESAAPPVEGDFVATWRTLSVELQGDTLAASLEGVEVLRYTDPQSLASGGIALSTGISNDGAVSVDDVFVTRLPAPEVTPVPVTPEATDEVVIPVLTETPEETEVADTGVVVLSADFESDPAGWTLGTASIVPSAENDHALLIPAGVTFAPVNPIVINDVRVQAEFNLISDAADGQPAGLSVHLRANDSSVYTLSLEPARTVLSRSEEETTAEIASTAAGYPLNTWHTLDVSVQGGQITVSVDGSTVIDAADAAPLLAGNVNFTANAASNVLLDDIRITDLLGQALTVATPLPIGLTEAHQSKLDTMLYLLVEAQTAGDTEAFNSVLAQSGIELLDDAQRIYVDVWAAPNQSPESLIPYIEGVGGIVEFATFSNVYARVPLAGLVPLVNTELISSITLPAPAMPTSADDPRPAQQQTYSGSQVTEGFDIVGVNDWHNAATPVRGAGVNIAIIDVDFASPTGSNAADRACLNRGVSTATSYAVPVSTTGHGTRVAEVICDIAPSASIVGIQANSAASVANAINTARVSNRIIVISLDLGVNISPGDGTGGSDANAQAVYTAITNARNTNGVMVIAAAGNNNGRQIAFTHTTGTASTVDIRAYAGDRINLGWNGAALTGATVTAPGMITQNTGIRNTTTFGTFVNIPACTAVDDGDPLTNPNPCALTLTIPSGAPTTYLQVQVLGNARSSIVSSSPAADAAAGNIARPGDSPNAFTVGAVCVKGNQLFTDTAYSVGPIMASGGGAAGSPTATRNSVKPNIVAPTHVSISSTDINNGETGETDFDCNDGTGFNGTSAAAAHAAGMAALLISSTNTNLSGFDGASLAATNRIRDYMQTRTVELYAGANPDGYDMTFGAGLSVLGSPAPLYSVTATDPAAAPDQTGTCSGTLFVSSNDADSLQQGTQAEPYTNALFAIRQATVGACVIFLPGEYVTPLDLRSTPGLAPAFTLTSYDAVRSTDENDSSFWVNVSTLDTTAGIGILNHAVTIQGFIFNGSSPLRLNAFDTPGAINAGGSTTGITILNNRFDGFDQTPIVVDSSLGVTIDGNIFENNRSNTGAAINISQSGTVAAPVTVQNNTFRNNSVSTQSTPTEPLIRIFGDSNPSRVNIYANRFVTNSTRSIIYVSDGSSDLPSTASWTASRDVQVVSNLFLNNTNTGPIVHLDPGRYFQFVNNTVIGHTGITNSVYKDLITRGNGNGSNGTNGNGYWNIHNNLFYNNPSASTVINDRAANSNCANTSGTGNSGFQNNWVVNSGSMLADCIQSFQDGGGTPINGNLITALDEAIHFVGPIVDPNDPYRLRPPASPSSPQNPGVDAGNNAFVLPAVLTALDLLGNERAVNSDSQPDADVDIGAYELGIFAPVTGDVITDTFNEVSTATTRQLNLTATGGYPPYTFTLLTQPTNYDTNPANGCGGQAVAFDPLTNVVKYCPPLNFYTVGGPASSIAGLTFRVTDVFGATTIAPAGTGVGTDGTVTFDINPVNTNAPAGVTYDVYTPVDQTTSIRLRPFTRFSNFSRQPNSSEGLDYPYDFAFGSVQTCNVDNEPLLFDSATIAAQVNGTDVSSRVLSLDPSPGRSGCYSFSYSVTDRDGQSTSFTIRIRVANLPTFGLHDDTSFDWTYTSTLATGWVPQYQELAINNTVHQSNGLNDTADFQFIGTGFVLYMRGLPTAGTWDLQLDADGVGSAHGFRSFNNATEWAQLNGISGWSGFTCNSMAGTALVRPLNKLAAGGYTIACTGLSDSDAHILRVRNLLATPLLIDAIEVLSEGEPLLPGFHEVTDPAVAPLFRVGLPGSKWQRLNNVPGSSNLVAMSTLPASTGIPDISFTFEGTGIAIGTVSETPGASYTICVDPQVTASTYGGEVCQTFNNADGAIPGFPVWNVFRPLTGYYNNPSFEHRARIRFNNPPLNGRMVIDSIVVLSDEPTAPTGSTDPILPFGFTEDDVIGPIVFGGVVDNSWSPNTLVANASNRSLTSMSPLVTKAGPYVSFRIPSSADIVNWYRIPNAVLDSTSVFVCVDRAAGSTGLASNAGNCLGPINLRTAPNPLVISQASFPDNTWNGITLPPPYNTSFHTVEIFSTTNAPFNVDRLQVINSTGPLTAGYYEEFIANLQFSTNGITSGGNTSPITPVNTNVQPDFTRPFTPLLNNVPFSLYSGGYVARSQVVNVTVPPAAAPAISRNDNATMLFPFTGTGFAVYFTMEPWADQVEMCWKQGTENNAGNVEPGDVGVSCQIYDNELPAARYTSRRVVAGLPNNTYTAVVRMLEANNVHLLAYSGIRMEIDAVEVYGTSVLPTTVLNTTGVRYEPTNNPTQFTFIGQGWQGFSNPVYTTYSGKNFDQVNQVGAGIVFRTLGADGVLFYRSVYPGYAPVEACVTRDSDRARRCITISNSGGVGFQQAASIPLFDATAHTVTIMTTGVGVFIPDAVELISSGTPLTAGLYEDTHPSLRYSPLLSGTPDAIVNQYSQQWSQVIAANYSASSIMQSTVADNTNAENVDDPNDAAMVFTFTGTGFEIGTFIDVFGGEMEVCYNTGTTFNFGSASCYMYDNEALGLANAISRSVTGLNSGTYTVRVRNATDRDSNWYLTANPTGRLAGYSPARLRIDFVRIFNTLPPVINATGNYEENAGNGSNQYLDLTPSTAWTRITGAAAAGYSNQAYYAVTNSFGTPILNQAGQTATLQVAVPANQAATVILYTGAPSIYNTDKLLICVRDANQTAQTCTVTNSMRTSSQVVINSSTPDIGTLLNNTTAGTRTLFISYRALLPSFFRIDSFQVILGSTLTAGYYDDFVGTGLIQETSGTWTTVPSTLFSGGTARQSVSADNTNAENVDDPNDAAITFTFTGTGFEIGTYIDVFGGEMEVCYNTGTTFNFGSASCYMYDNEALGLANAISRSVTGLNNGTYTVRVRNATDRDSNWYLTANPTGRLAGYSPARLRIDFVRIFNTLPPFINATGNYEENAGNGSNQYLDLTPSTAWTRITGAAAAGYSNQAYYAVTNSFGTPILNQAGQTATLQVAVPANQAATVILYTGAPSIYNTDKLLICVRDASQTAQTCTVTNSMRTSSQVVINSSTPDIGTLLNNTTAGTRTLFISYRALLPSFFRIDSFQVILGSTLTAGYYEDFVGTGLIQETSGTWTTVPSTLFSGGTARQSLTDGAAIQFDFQGTGFSLVTLFDSLSGTALTNGLRIDIDQTPFGSVNKSYDVSSYFAGARYRSAHSITGLPFGIYRVTITELNAATPSKLVLDALEIYGNYATGTAMTVGNYDNAAVNGSSVPYFSYGPNNGTWTARTGAFAAGFSNLTNQTSINYGANVTFQVSNANQITISYGASTLNTSKLRVCSNVMGAAGLTNCSEVSTVPASFPGSLIGTVTVPLGSVGNYIISLTNVEHLRNFVFDGVRVEDTTLGLTEGTYQEDYSGLTFAGGVWTSPTAEALASNLRARSTTDNGAYVEFNVRGSAFAVVLNESTTTSSSYSLCYDETAASGGDGIGGGNDSCTTYTPSNQGLARVQVALPVIGLNPNNQYQVRVTNLDATPAPALRPLVFDRVDVVGDVTTSIPSTGRVENTDPTIRYLPFGSMTELTVGPVASANTMHRGVMKGSVIYFEVTGRGVEYFRQMFTGYGNVEICYGNPGSPGSATCSTVSNSTTSGYQLNTQIDMLASSTYWVSIRNLEGKTVTLDFLQVYDPNAPLTAGFYQESNPALRYSDDGGTQSSGGVSDFITNPIAPAAASPVYSGGYVRRTATLGGAGTDDNGNMMFSFTGTGFAVYFTSEPWSDLVELCWKPGTETNPLNMQPGDTNVTCQQYENERPFTLYQVRRAVTGLTNSTYTAIARMLEPDNTHLPVLSPVRMEIDAVEVYGNTLPATVLNTTGVRYETTNNPSIFTFHGTGWLNFANPAYTNFSGANWSQNQQIGAGFTFRTNSVNSVLFYRSVYPGYAPIEACITRESDGRRRCINVANNQGVAFQQPVAIPLFDSSAHIVSISTTNSGVLQADAVELVNVPTALPAGLYEDNHPGLRFSPTLPVPGVNAGTINTYTSNWAPVYLPGFTQSRAMLTTVADNTNAEDVNDAADASLIFTINGTGFEIGTFSDIFSGEMEVCYIAGTTFSFVGAQCYIYDNENNLANTAISRTVTGLAAGNYTVRVRNATDRDSSWYLTTNPTGRLAVYNPARLRIDYVRVFNDTLEPVTAPGLYNQDAANSGTPYLRLSPASSWGTISGLAAAAFSNQNYSTVVDTLGRATTLTAGPTVTMQLQVPASGATVLLATGPANAANTNKLLVCANNVSTSSCAVLPSGTATLKTETQVIVDSTVLSALGSAGTVNLSFRALTPGFFSVDGFQVIHGNVLPQGLYQEFLPDGLLDFEPNILATGTGLTEWNAFKFLYSSGGALARTGGTTALGRTLTFNFQGTGFSIIAQNDLAGVDMRICYQTLANGQPFPATNTVITTGYNVNGIRCEVVNTDTALTSFQYGFSYYGLASDTYRVEVRHVDTTTIATDYLRVDAIAVFDNPAQALTEGMHDNTSPNVVYGPNAFWTLNRTFVAGPPYGPWQMTEHYATNNGSIAQVTVNGNALTVYQTANVLGSLQVRVCVATPGINGMTMECTDYSQFQAAQMFASPVTFYGFGNGTHQVILENRSHGRRLSIDGFRAWPDR